MRIGMQTWGSHGDVRPFLALAAGLNASGHDVSLVITSIDGADYARSFSEAGFKIQSVASPVVRIAEEYVHIGNRIFSESNPVKQAKAILDTLFVPVEDEMFQASEQLCLDNELVIGHYIHYAVQTAAERIGRPYVSIMLAHNAIPSSLQPPVGIPSLGKLGNRISWWMVRTVLNKTLKTYPDRLRAAHGLGPTTDLISDVWASHQLT